MDTNNNMHCYKYSLGMRSLSLIEFFQFFVYTPLALVWHSILNKTELSDGI